MPTKMFQPTPRQLAALQRYRAHLRTLPLETVEKLGDLHRAEAELQRDDPEAFRAYGLRVYGVEFGARANE